MIDSDLKDRSVATAQVEAADGRRAPLAGLYLVVAFIHAVLSVTTGEGVLRQWRLTVSERLAAFGLELCLLAAFIAVVGCPMVWMARRTIQRTILRWSRRIGAVALLSLLLFVYLASWGQYWSTGTFLGREAIEFFLSQMMQVLGVAPARLLLSVPLAAVVGAVLVAWSCSPRARSAAPRRRMGLTRWAAMGLLALSAGFAVLARPTEARRKAMTVDGWVGMSYTIDEWFTKVQWHDSGPFTHAMYDLAQAIRGDGAIEPPPSGPPVMHQAIVPLEQYIAGASPSSPSYNVIVVLVESLRWDQVRLCGGTRAVMPNVDALAERSLVYPDTYAQASHTNYSNVCPMSGHYPLRSTRTHVYPRHPAYPRVLIYDILKARGYRVGMFSSQNESWGGMLNYLTTPSFDRMLHVEVWNGPKYVPRDVHLAKWIEQTRSGGTIDDRYTVAEAIKWIDESPSPFFAYMNLQNAHFPYNVPGDYPVHFGPREVDFPVAFNYYPREKAQVVKDMYSDCARYVDAQLGKLLDHLRESGRLDRTIIAITGDHGQAFYEHHFATHANVLLEEGVRVPLVVWAPGRAPRVDPRPAQQIDVPPTILDLLGLPPHPGYQGLSLVASKWPERRSRYLVAQTPLAHQYAVVRDGWKLIRDMRMGRNHLYNLRTDPGERSDATAEQPQLSRQLLDRLDTWRAVQLEYYARTRLHTSVYPPVVQD